MKNFNDSFERFFKTNEYKQNKFIMRIILWVLIAIPFLLLGRQSGIFPEFDIKLIYIDLIIFICGYCIAFIFEKIRPYSSLIKYIILFTVEINVIIISIGQGSLLYISYIIVPLLSCIYLDRKFSIKILIISYILMIISLIHRAYFLIPGYTSGITPERWLTQYTAGLTIEYCLVACVVLIVASRNTTIVDTDYKEVVKAFNSQREITASYVAMLSQKQAGLEKHLARSSNYVEIICNYLQRNKKYSDILTDNTVFNYVTASYLHDIGVISIPDSILNKKGALNNKETKILHAHPILGYNLIKANMSQMNHDYLEILCDMTLYHHERWDGNGYPYGLSGEKIPLAGRVMAGANYIDNLLTGAAFRAPVTFDKMLEIIKELEGTALDPEIARVILKASNDIKAVYERQNFI